jgi:hypothetical protein
MDMGVLLKYRACTHFDNTRIQGPYQGKTFWDILFMLGRPWLEDGQNQLETLLLVIGA